MVALDSIAMPLGLAFGSAMVVLFFGCGLLASYFYLLFLRLESTRLFVLCYCYFVVKYANIFYLSCKDLSDRIRKITPTVFFLHRNRYDSTDP